MSKDLKNACRSVRDMDEYLEVRSSREIIDDIKASSSQETLRDQFAGRALPQFLAMLSTITHLVENDEQMMEIAATKSYAMADAMLAARAVASEQ